MPRWFAFSLIPTWRRNWFSPSPLTSTALHNSFSFDIISDCMCVDWFSHKYHWFWTEYIHNSKKRMSLILHKSEIAEWIRTEADKARIQQLMIPYLETEMNYHSISTDAGNARKQRNIPEIKNSSEISRTVRSKRSSFVLKLIACYSLRFTSTTLPKQ